MIYVGIGLFVLCLLTGFAHWWLNVLMLIPFGIWLVQYFQHQQELDRKTQEWADKYKDKKEE